MALLRRPALSIPAAAAGRLRSGRLALFAVAVLVTGVALLQVHQFSQVTSTGYQVDGLTQVRAEKQARNHELEAEVAALSSLGRVDWEARTRLHMEPPKQRLYIDVNQPAPQRETLPTRFLPAGGSQAGAAQPGATPSQPFWRRVLKLLPLF